MTFLHTFLVAALFILASCGGNIGTELGTDLGTENSSGLSGGSKASPLQEPLNIPVTIAKEINIPRYWLIHVSLENGEISLSGEATSIPSPQVLKQVEIRNLVTGDTLRASVAVDGSFVSEGLDFEPDMDSLTVTPIEDNKLGVGIRLTYNAQDQCQWFYGDDLLGNCNAFFSEPNSPERIIPTIENHNTDSPGLVIPTQEERIRNTPTVPTLEPALKPLH